MYVYNIWPLHVQWKLHTMIDCTIHLVHILLALEHESDISMDLIYIR